MNTNFSFRSSTHDDIPSLMLVGLASYGEYLPELTEENGQKLVTGMSSTDSWKKILDTSSGFVCEHDGVIVGMAFLVKSGNPWEVFESDWAYIRLVGIHPDHKGKGLARALTKLCLEEAKRLGEKHVALHTSEMMPAARHIYESMGFKVLREIPERLGKRYWLYMLEL
jgi:GNAT superfamily N-acetyltransferase